MSDTALSSAAIKLLFETGDVPTQQNFADAWTSYSNLVDNNALDGYETGITAHAGGGQGSAYAITKRVSAVATVATAGDSLIVPAALVAREGFIVNTGNNACNVFTQSGENWVSDAANAAISLPSGYTLRYYCVSTGSYWYQFISDTGQAQNIVKTQTSASTLDVFPSLWNTYQFTALAAGIAINGPTFEFGTGQDLTFIIKDNGTSQTLTWNSVYAKAGGSLPAATYAGKTMILKFKKDNSTAKWYNTSVSIEGLYEIPCKIYRARLVQAGTAAPVATVFENNTGQTVSWSRLSSGRYTATTTDLFTVDKTFVLTTLLDPTTDDVGVFVHINEDAPSEIYFFHQDDSFGLDADNVAWFVEIRVYP